jgi:putative transposase
MPRQPRLIVAGYPHHLVIRGNNRSAIFYSEKDRHFFIDSLLDVKEDTGCLIYSYCLMTNHVHLLAEPETEDGIRRMIQCLGRRYVRYINSTYERTGTLWEGRYKSSVVSKDSYLLACCRYIELNPLRAKIVKDPSQYPWSSYSFRAEGKPHKLLTEDPVYRAFGDTPSERQRAYQKWMKGSIPDGEWSTIRHMTQRGGLIGDQDFLNRISKILSRDLIFRSRGRPRRGRGK